MSNRTKPLILLAEDESDVSLVTRTRLEANGFEVATASDGEEALVKLHQLKPDLVLLDLKMPKLDGYQVCRAIKQDPETKSIPVILFSASSAHSLALRDKCIELGADDHVRKPYVPEELLAKIRRLLAKQEKQAPDPGVQGGEASCQLEGIIYSRKPTPRSPRPRTATEAARSSE